MGAVQSKRKQKESSKYAYYQGQKAALSMDTHSASGNHAITTSAPRLTKGNLNTRTGLLQHRSSSNDRLSQQSIKDKSVSASLSSSPSPTQQQQQLQQQRSNSNMEQQRQHQPLEYTGLQSNSVFLPKDWDAQDRHYALHFALKQLYGDNTFPPVLPKIFQGARIADVGCVNGAWIMDMASQYPECQFIGIDTATELSPDPLALPNVQFESTEDLKALPLDDESIDVVHMRALNLRTPVDSWLPTLREVHRVLKPGGVVQLVDLHNVPAGTVLIESFIETIRAIWNAENEDYDMVLKLPNLLQRAGFQILQNKKKKIYFASDGKLGETFMAVMLQWYEANQSFLAPRMGLEPDDYRLRVEMVCAQCVKHNAHVDWYAYIAKKF